MTRSHSSPYYLGLGLRLTYQWAHTYPLHDKGSYEQDAATDDTDDNRRNAEVIRQDIIQIL